MTLTLFMMAALLFIAPDAILAQRPMDHVVNVTTLKSKWPEKGTLSERDSLVGIYNALVINKNEFILSHREYRHYYTPSSSDYMILEEYADLTSMEKAGDMMADLEKAAWPDEAQRKAFMDRMNSYFENWHGDAIYSMNPKLSKN